MENEFIELGFHVWKTSSLNSEDGKLVPSNVWLCLQKMDLIRSSSYQIVLRELVVGKSISCGVHDRFPCMENEFIELIFHTWKSSSLNSVFVHGNRVR